MPLLLAWLIHGILLAATIYGVLRLTRGPSAAMRYALYWSALVVVLALPLASRARVPSFLPLSSLSMSALTSAVTSAVSSASAVSAASANSTTSPASAPRANAAAQAADAGAQADATWSWPVVQLPRLPDWLVAIAIGLWLGTVLLALLRIALGIDAIQRLKESCRPFPAARARRLTGWADARRRGRLVELCLCDDVSNASFLGLTRPVIAISPALAATLSDEELDLTVLHEFAHVQRRDDWTKLLQLGVMAICGWHPAVRLLDRAIDLERESACDDWVVRATGAPRSYARCLVKIAETMPRATAALVPGAHASEAPMETRIKRLLDRGRARGAWAPVPATATAFAMALLALVITHASPLPLIVRTAAPAQAIDVAARGGAMQADAANVARSAERVARGGDDARLDVAGERDSRLAAVGGGVSVDGGVGRSVRVAVGDSADDRRVVTTQAASSPGESAARAGLASASASAPTSTAPLLMASMFPSLRPQRPAQLTPGGAQARNVAMTSGSSSISPESAARARAGAGASQPVVATQAQTSIATPLLSWLSALTSPSQAQQTPAPPQTGAVGTRASDAGAASPAIVERARTTTSPSPVSLEAANSATAAATGPRADKRLVATDDRDDDDGDDDAAPGPTAKPRAAAAADVDPHGSGAWGAGAVGGGMKAAGAATSDGLKEAGTATGSGVRIASVAAGKATGTAASKTGDSLKKAGTETARAFGRAKRAFGSLF